MCKIFASQSPEAYELITRSVRLNGYSTSIRLESYFWAILDEIAAQQNMTTPRFMSTLYDEVMELRGEVGNFTSLLRVTCALYIGSLRDKPRAITDEKPQTNGRHKGIPPLIDAVA
jgi:predicted DNA-binding ribbon-helix-helix protein